MGDKQRLIAHLERDVSERVGVPLRNGCAGSRRPGRAVQRRLWVADFGYRS
jgi:hypothetical protein